MNMVRFVVRHLHSRDVDLCTWDLPAPNVGDHVLYEHRLGTDLGLVLAIGGNDGEAKTALRVAGEADLETYRQLAQQAEHVKPTVAERIQAHRLPMHLVATHYTFDRERILVYFTADDRVDFRALVRDLAGVLRMRVEMRQIGPREETRMVGAIGVCGRCVCCNSISDRLGRVSIRMAKDQNYSLTSEHVNGACKRLLCCLAYEHEFYLAERGRYPRVGQKIMTNDHCAKVQECNMLSGCVALRLSEGGVKRVPVEALRRGPDGWSVAANSDADHSEPIVGDHAPSTNERDGSYTS